jgi:hypothetical protein
MNWCSLQIEFVLPPNFRSERFVYFTFAIHIGVIEEAVLAVTPVIPAGMIENGIQTEA